MDSVVASRVNQRTVWKLNSIALFLNSLWISIVLWVRKSVDGITRVPYLALRRLTPARVIAAFTLGSLVVAPFLLYFTEKGHHIETRRAYRALSFSSASETGFLRSSLQDLLDERIQLTTMLLDSGNTVYSGDKVYVKVIATGYSSSVFETDDTPFITAANTQTREGIIALSRDLLSRHTPGAPFSFGNNVHVSGLGNFVVEDVMNARWTNRIDVWFPTRAQAIEFGVREAYLSGTLDEDSRIDPDLLSQNAAAGSIHNEL